jgi:hypothetical protein
MDCFCDPEDIRVCALVVSVVPSAVTTNDQSFHCPRPQEAASHFQGRGARHVSGRERDLVGSEAILNVRQLGADRTGE